MVSRLGSSTCTGWKRRSKAESFSKKRRYSSVVVAPMSCTPPLAKAGFKRLAASMAPSALPAPTRVCSSSRKRMTFPARATSFKMFFMRSSNSPRYFVPAMTEARSRASRRLWVSASGTCPRAMRWARASTTAVLPTPASPNSTGLFLVRRNRI